MPLRSEEKLIVEAASAMGYLRTRAALTKALDPLKPGDFNVLVSRLSATLRKTVAPHESASVAAAMQAADVNWAVLSVEQTNAAVRAINLAITNTLPPTVIPTITSKFEVAGQKVTAETKKKTAAILNNTTTVKYDAQDKNIIKYVSKSQGNYITDEYGNRAGRASGIARRVVKEGMEEGLDRYAIGAALDDALTAMQLGRSEAYFDMIASVYMNRARTYAQLSAFDQADVEKYEFDAVLDEVTTLQCRFMHGRIFDVAPALAKHQEVGGGEEEPADALPWLNSGRTKDGEQVIFYKNAAGKRVQVASVVEDARGKSDETGSFTSKLSDKSLQNRGLTTPPLHANCRSTLIPV